LIGWALGAAILITLAALNYNPPNDTITSVTIVGFVLLGIAMTIFYRDRDRARVGWRPPPA
jgi:hypothetical protein